MKWSADSLIFCVLETPFTPAPVCHFSFGCGIKIWNRNIHESSSEFRLWIGYAAIMTSLNETRNGAIVKIGDRIIFPTES